MYLSKPDTARYSLRRVQTLLIPSLDTTLILCEYVRGELSDKAAATSSAYRFFVCHDRFNIRWNIFYQSII